MPSCWCRNFRQRWPWISNTHSLPLHLRAQGLIDTACSHLTDVFSSCVLPFWCLGTSPQPSPNSRLTWDTGHSPSCLRTEAQARADMRRWADVLWVLGHRSVGSTGEWFTLWYSHPSLNFFYAWHQWLTFSFPCLSRAGRGECSSLVEWIEGTQENLHWRTALRLSPAREADGQMNGPCPPQIGGYLVASQDQTAREV